MRTAPLPVSGSRDEVLQTGAQLFFSSRGTFKAPAGATASHLGRMSQDGWMSCSSCHFNGWTDGVVWQFDSGPRKSLSLAGTVNPRDRSQQRILNYSAIFDEVEDFELNIRNTQGPGPRSSSGSCETGLPNSTYNPNYGLLIGDLGSFNLPPCEINPFIPRNAGRQQVKVDPPGATTRVPTLTALREWVRFAVRSPNGPLNSNEIAGGVSASALSNGRTLFGQQCANCHGGPLWTRSIRDAAPPPPAVDISCETNVAGSPAGSACFTPALSGNPIGTQYLAHYLSNVGSYNLGVAGKGNDIGANIGAPEKAARELVNGVAQPPKDALGFDFNGDGKGTGYTIPSLLGISMSQPYMHNGACESIACVVGDRDHRTGNGQFPDLLDTAAKRRNVTLFVESIDAKTAPFK